MPNDFDLGKAARLIRVWRARQIIHRAEVSGIENKSEAKTGAVIVQHRRI
jgi:hypothetical protein